MFLRESSEMVTLFGRAKGIRYTRWHSEGSEVWARGVEQEIFLGWAVGSCVDRILEYREQDEKWTG